MAAVARSSASFSGRRARPGVRQHRRADLRLAVDGEPREMPGHRAAVTDEQALAAAVELEPRSPRHRPAGVVDHRAHVRHLLERRRRQHAVVARDEERAPPRQVAGRRPELAERTGAAEIELGLEPDGVRVGLDEVAARGRLGLVRRRARQAQRLEDPLLERLLPGAAVGARDDLAEQREGEVGVVPPRARIEHLLCLGGPGEQILARRRLHRLPDLPRRLALEPGEVREHAADRRPVRALRQVRGERVVERELAGVSQLHDPDRRERLRDRADPILRLRRRHPCRVDVRVPERLLPQRLAAAEDRRADRRHPLLRLGGRQPVLEVLAEPVRRGHALPMPAGSHRARRRCPRRSRRGA